MRKKKEIKELKEIEKLGDERVQPRGYPTPGILYEYQKKGDAGGGFCVNVKRKEL